MHKILEDLNWRYATKEFDSTKKVSREDLNTLIEAFRLTASSFWLQPWKLVVVQNQEIKDSLVEHSWGQKQIANCSDLLVLCRVDNFWDTQVDEFLEDIVKTRWGSREDLKWYEDMMKWFLSRMSQDEINTWSDKQVYIALWNLMTACANMRIDTCPIEGFISEKYDEILNLQEKWLASVVLLPIGYRSENDKYKNLEKVRFQKNKIIEII